MKKYNEEISYKIVENGYDIYLNGELWITQDGQYSHLFVPNGTLEENCLAQIEELTTVSNEPSQLDVIEAQVMYTALMTDTIIESEV